MVSLTETGVAPRTAQNREGVELSEVGLILGILLILAGAGAWIFGLEYWRIREFGALDPEKTLRIVIPGVVCFTLGFQVVLSSFFLSVLGMSRR